MDDDTLLRYSRQIMLPEFGAEGQERLSRASVLLIGLGGLGSACATYLCAAGVGHLVTVDNDRVDLSNLQRQVLFEGGDIGVEKTTAGARRLHALNPGTQVTLITERAQATNLDTLVPEATVVVDGSDNFPTRHAVNRACVAHGKPLVSGAVIGFRGEISVFAGATDAACYACLYGDLDTHNEETCAEQGVMAPLPGIVGAMQALEVLKLIARVGQPLKGRILRYDGWTGSWSQSRLDPDPSCPVCA